jgi:translation initiation factor 1
LLLDDGAGEGRSQALSKARLVYSTGAGRICPDCGWPERDCKCSRKGGTDEAVPARVVAKLRVEKAGRGGKTVTVLYDLPRNAEFLKGLSQELKRACGTGGAVVDDTIELQGELRDRVREFLAKKGIGVKG